MSAIHHYADVSDDERREALYRGDIFILAPTPGSRALVALAKQMLEEAFAPLDPRDIHKHMTPEQAVDTLAKLKPAFIHDPRCKSLIEQIMGENGVDLEKLYFDVPRMRSAYPSDFLASGIAYAFHPHRDTWYSAPMCQLNWWMPIFPILPNNAMGFYPRYFSEGLKNSSDTYNYYEWNTKNRATAAQNVRSDTRQQPKAQEPVEGKSLRLMVPPASIILFSGAQLHETVENTSGIARYSIDFRTVHRDDVANKRGAANVDSASTGTTMRDYLRCGDRAHLPEELIALYDDGSAAGEDRVLYFGDRLVKAGE